MQITLEIPDEIAALLALSGHDPTRAALESIGLDAYRQHRIGGLQLRKLLGIPSRFQLDAFLKEHKVEKYTAEDFDHDLATLQQTEDLSQTDRRA